MLHEFTRADWGATPPKWLTPVEDSDIKMLVIHYLGYRQSGNRPTAETLRAIQNMHKAKKRVADIQYTAALGPEGLYQLRWDQNRNAANRPKNETSVSLLVLIGTECETQLPAWVLSQLQPAVWMMVKRWPLIRKIKLHRQVALTECPGDLLAHYLKHKPPTLHTAEFRVTQDIVDAAKQHAADPGAASASGPAISVDWKPAPAGTKPVVLPQNSPKVESIDNPPPFPNAPRGWLNNNPVNIRKGDRPWLQPYIYEEQPDDGAFICFKTPVDGMQAAICHIQSHYLRKGYVTISDIITRWAPPSDGNDTNAYIGAVCQRTGFSGNMNVSRHTNEMLPKLLWAMSIQEIGKAWADDESEPERERYCLQEWQKALQQYANG